MAKNLTTEQQERLIYLEAHYDLRTLKTHEMEELRHLQAKRDNANPVDVPIFYE